MFNSRTCQLVLGAGAMQVRNLKSITAKHLGKLNILIFFNFFYLLKTFSTCLSMFRSCFNAPPSPQTKT